MLATFTFADDSLLAADARAVNRRLLWASIAVVGIVYFFVGHNLCVSQCERYAPWSDAENVLESGQNAAKGLALALIGGFGVYLALRRDGRPLRLSGPLPMLILACFAWSTSSVLWSIQPMMTCKRLAVLGFCAAFAIGFARQFRPRDVPMMAMTIAASYLLVGVAAELALGTFRPWESGYRFAGTVHPNSQGAHLVVLCLASYCLARSATRGRAWLWTLFAVGVLFLLLTKSRTSCAGLALALGALWLTTLSYRGIVLTAFSAGFLLSAAALVVTLFGADVDRRLGDAVLLGRRQESEALTGRLPIWSELSRYVAARPLQGYGYESFWTAKHIEAVSDEVEWPLREAHNAFLDGTLGVGLIGLALFAAAVIVSMWQAARAYLRTRDPGFAFTFALLVMGTVNACLESGMTAPNFMTLLGGAGILQLLTIL